MVPVCPNSQCSNYKKSSQIHKDGFFFRRDDSRKIQRFRCRCCGKRFSAATSTFEYRQQKRRHNRILFGMLCSKVTIRRAAMLLDLDKNTVMRRMKSFAAKSRFYNDRFLLSLDQSVVNLEFDDQLTKEQTKMKPLSITLAVNKDTREILAGKVSQIPAFGHLAKKSVAKYGYRKSFHLENMKQMFEKIKPAINPYAVIKSDQHKSYPDLIKKLFPNADHRTYKGAKGAVTGQGELKKQTYDPLFHINHICATMRDDLSVLVRKTWAVTQRPERLQDYIEMVIYFHNHTYLPYKRQHKY